MTQLTDKMEGLIKDTPNEFDIGSERSTPKIIRDNGFNQGVTASIALVKAEEAEVGKINNYPTYYQTVVASPKWLAWGKVAHQHGFDWDESVRLKPYH